MPAPHHCQVCGEPGLSRRTGWCDLCRRAERWGRLAKGGGPASAKRCRTAREHHRILKLYSERAAREEPLFG